jgi:hypothetical protein
MKGTHGLGLSPSWRRTLTIGAIGALLAAVPVVGAQAAGTSPVVPSGGTVAGHGYPYWLGVAEGMFFTYGGSPPQCQTLHANGQAIEFLDGVDTDKTITCKVAAQEPIYVHGITNECSTLHGDHNGFGTTPTDLKRCARHGFKGLRGTASVDGVPVSDYSTLTSATPVIDARLPKHNAFHLPPQRLRSVGYGEGLLLRGFAAGTHRIGVGSFTPGGNQRRTFVVHVR